MQVRILRNIKMMITLLFIAMFTQTILSKHDKMWVNWGRNQTCCPKAIFEPSTLEELTAVIKTVRDKKGKLGMFGGSHSWSPIVCSEYLLSTHKLNKLLDVNRDNSQVRVESGILIHELNTKLAELGLALPNQSFTQAQSLAGNIATATHGTGKTGTFASFVVALELVTADGQVRKLSAQESPEQFAAALVGIGTLGVIYSITLQCVPLFKVKHERTRTTWVDASKNYRARVQEHDFYQFFWNPYTNSVLEYSWDKTTQERTPVRVSLRQIADRSFIGHWTGELWKTLLHVAPDLTPTLGNLFHRLAVTTNKIDYPHEIMTAAKKSNQEMVYEEEEIAVPAQHLVAAAQDVQALLEKYRKRDKFYMFLWGVLFRFVQKDPRALISTAGFDDTVYISVIATRINADFYKEFEDAMMKYNGRPHWGKINFLNYSRAKKLYGDNLDKFIKIRKKLDPQEMFLNNYTSALFAPKKS